MLLVPLTAIAADIRPFSSDGCSLFPDGTAEENALWMNCCIVHDLAYWKGGSRQQRLLADEALHQCVQQVGEGEIASVMLAGVRVGGSPYWPSNFRWGYGWPYLRGYKELTPGEKQSVSKRLLELDIMIKVIQEQLK